MRNNQGFTIIEIMVIVAIMAILAGISIPQYQRMVNKGNQQGAVAGLTSIYMAEKNFAAENHTYTACIGSIGITPATGPKWYTLGFKADNLQASCGEGGNGNCATSAWDEGSPVQTCASNTAGSDNMIADRVQRPDLSVPIPSGTTLGTLSTDMSRTMFTARAAGNVSSKSNFDRWTIDQNGAPQNTQQNI
jgi:prepilin-type N-terminal cleavage/methylation domain-containing protein